MAEAKLILSGEGQQWQADLDPAGMLIGRIAACDIVLENPQVSRNHARLCRDPFGRWVIEDLGSHNGVWVHGKRIETRPIEPGEVISIGPFSLVLSQALDEQIPADATVIATKTILREATSENVTTQEAPPRQTLSSDYLARLNEIADHLAELASPADLYPAACRCVAEATGAITTALRLKKGDDSLPDRPEVLGCYVGGDTSVEGGSRMPPDLHLSRRALEAVRSSGVPVMASNVQFRREQLDLTVVGDHAPRAVFCAPVADTSDAVDALYLDLPTGRAAKETLDFVQAVARQVGFAGRSLLFAEAKAERRLLDQQLALAREIQMNLTPKRLEGGPELDIAMLYKPAMWVGGDYCDVWRLPDNRLAFAVGDVSGKGLPAAMVMMCLHAALRTTLQFCPDLSEAAAHVSKHLRTHMPEKIFVTIVFGFFDPGNSRIEYVNAGHILPVMVKPSEGPFQLGKPQNQPLGVAETRFTADTAEMGPGEGLVIVTDGITESRSQEGKQFGVQRLLQTIADAQPLSSGRLAETLNDEAAVFRHPRAQQDDITVLAILRTVPDAAKI